MITRCEMNQGPTARCASAAQDCFVFRVEGTGALQTHEVVSMALEWLQSKMKNLREALASSLEEDVPMEM